MAAFESITFQPKCAVKTPQCDLATTVAGIPLSMPFLLAPLGSTRMFYPRGEEAAAGAAGAAGIGYTLSTFSGCRLEDVKAASSGPCLLQLYLVGDKDVSFGGPVDPSGSQDASILMKAIEGPLPMIDKFVNSKIANVQLIHVRMNFSSHLNEVGRFRFSKVLHLFGLVARLMPILTKAPASEVALSR